MLVDSQQCPVYGTKQIFTAIEFRKSQQADDTLTHPLYISSMSFSILFHRIDVHNAAAPTLGSPLFLRTPPPTYPTLFIPDSKFVKESMDIRVGPFFLGCHLSNPAVLNG